MRPRLCLLGGFEFVAATPGLSRKARALLAYLALQIGHSQSREKLASLLWGSNEESQARMSLRQTLSAIRRQVPSGDDAFLVTEGDSVALKLDAADSDVARFEALAASSDPERLAEAAATYRGDLLDGFSLKEEPFEDWLRIERERLRSLSIAVLEKLVAHYAATNSPTACIRAATRLLAAEPLREDMHRALMQAYVAKGSFNLALRQFERCRDALMRDLRVRPEPETEDLYRDLRARRARAVAPGATPLAVALANQETKDPSEIRRPQTHYVKSAGVSIAYQVTGSGPIDMVYVQGWVSNLDYAWGSPRLSHVFRRLGSFCRLIRIDKRGTGLSDRNVGFATLDERMEDVRAVLDAVGSKRTVLFGSSEGGNMCILFAATYPERTSALVLNGCSARGLWSPDYPWAKTRQELEEELIAIERDWGEPADLGRAAPSLMDDAYERDWFAAYLTNSASPADAISLWRWNTEIDVRDILPAIHLPTLVVQRKGDRWVRVEEAHYLAGRIAGARYVELPGDDHLIWGADSDRLVDTIQDFLVSDGHVPAKESVLLTVLHMQGGGGRPASGELGNGFVSALLEDETVADALRLADGNTIRRTANGFVAVFQRPTRAIRCAMAVRRQMAEIGLETRAAIHTGECEKQGDLLTGLAIELTSGLLDHARPGEIVATRTVRDLVFGSSLAFDERGDIELVGIPGSWQVCLLREG